MKSDSDDIFVFGDDALHTLGGYELGKATPVVAQTLCMILKNREQDTADIEGYYDIQDQLFSPGFYVEMSCNAPLLSNFLGYAAQHLPSAAALVAGKFLPDMLYQAGSHQWPTHLARSFLKQGVTKPHEVDSIEYFIDKVTNRFDFESNKTRMDFDQSRNRDQLLVMVGLAYSAVLNGVTPAEKTAEHMLSALESQFCMLVAPNGFTSIARITHDLIGEHHNQGVSQERRAFMVDRVLNPLFALAMKNASTTLMFGTQISVFLKETQRIFRSAKQFECEDVHLFDPGMVTSLAFMAMMGPKDVMQTLFKSHKRNQSVFIRLRNLTNALDEFVMELGAMPHDSEMKTLAFTNLMVVASTLMSRLEGCSTSDSDPVLNVLATHVDLVAIRSSSTRTVRAFLGDYIMRCRSDLAGSLSSKERGKLLENELGL